MSDTEPLLRIENLTVDFPLRSGTVHAVRDVSLEIGRGETLAVVGESGSGKSVTSLSVLRLLPNTAKVRARRLEFRGKDLLGMSRRDLSSLRGNRIAMIFQDPMTALNPSFTIGDQLMEVARLHQRLDSNAARARAVSLLDKVGISAPSQRLRQFPHELSGGLRQRVVIAMALMCDPDLLIADEPTTALDVSVQAQILELLQDLQSEFHMGLLFVTHDLGIVARLADRVAVMYAGQIVEMGRTAELFSNPRHPYTQGLLDCIPVPGRLERGAMLGTIPGIVPSLTGDLAPGCTFADRCPRAMSSCRQGNVELRLLKDASYRCLLDSAPATGPLMEAML